MFGPYHCELSVFDKKQARDRKTDRETERQREKRRRGAIGGEIRSMCVGMRMSVGTCPLSIRKRF